MISKELLETVKSKKIEIKTPVKTVMILPDKNYYCLTTGEFFDDKKTLRKKYTQNETFLIKCGPGVETTIFVQYHEDINCISMSQICIVKTMPNKAMKEKREWTVKFTLWITSDKEAFYLKNGECVYVNKQKDIPVAFTGDILESSIEKNTLLTEFSKLLNTSEDSAIYFVSPSKCEILKKIDTVMDFIFYKDIIKKEGPKQKKIDELSSLISNSLSYEKIYNDLEIESASINVSSGDRYYKLLHQLYCYKLEKINEKYCVLRIFYFNKIYKTAEEIVRIFVGKKEIIFTRKNYKNEFVNMRTPISPNFFKSYASYMYDFSENDISDTKMEYYKDFILTIPKKIRGTMTYFLIKYPIFEKIYKLGLGKYVNHAYMIEDFDYEDIYYPLYEVLGINEEKTDNVLKFLGLTSYQLQSILKKFPDFNETLSHHDQHYPIKEMKSLFGKSDISDIDPKTFNAYLECYYTYCSYRGRKAGFSKITRTLNILRIYYSHHTEVIMAPKIFMLAITPVTGERENIYGDYINPALNYYFDYLSMVKRMQEPENFPANFNSIEEVKIMHDNIIEIFNLHKEEYAMKAFEERKKLWNKYTYKNDKYSVIYPESPEDLAKEGIELHHCVKSYISRITDGTTNILFIRKNEELNKPFFTVEISNEGVIEQIHGFSNRNVCTEEGLGDFVDEWKEKLRLKSQNFNKVR